MTFTFEFEHQIPVLPIPDLGSTFEQLETCIKPLNVADGYHRHHQHAENEYKLYSAISRFLKSEVAQKLQSKLLELNLQGSDLLDSSQLDIYSHALTREIEGDVLPRNPFLVLSPDAVEGIEQHDRAAVLCHSALKFISALRRGVLPPEKDHSGTPLSMLPYTALFGTTRCLPSVKTENRGNCDEAASLCDSQASKFSNDYEITEKTHPSSTHIVVISRGQYYTLEVLNSENAPLYDDDALSQVLLSILADSTELEHLAHNTALGSFTACSLKQWKHARVLLEKQCPTELAVMDSALFVLVLDESSTASDPSRECKRLFYGSSTVNEQGVWQGSCCSRWYDKLQLVVTKDAKASVIWDSLTCDGSAIMRFASDIYADSVLRLAREIDDSSVFSLWDSPSATNACPSKRVKKLVWELSDTMKEVVSMSESNLADLVCRHDIVQKNIPYGRNIAHRLGVNPDSMIQVAIQLAHFTLYGKMSSTFEPVSTRAFRNSRSAFVPVQNQQIFELCQLYNSNLLDEHSKVEMFVSMCDIHRKSVGVSKRGLGFEKHFNMLRYLYQHYRKFQINLTPEDLEVASDVFDSDLISPLSNPEIIAAHCGNSAVTGFGINPAVPQGFGIGYSLGPDRCELTVTSQFRQGGRFLSALKKILDQMLFCKSQCEKNPILSQVENERSCRVGPIEISPQSDLLKQWSFSREDVYEIGSKSQYWNAFEPVSPISSKVSTQPASANNSINKERRRSNRSDSVTMELTSRFLTNEEKMKIGRQISLNELAPLWGVGC
ncbi:LAFA_0D16798g1_1 [Lachancea sp. 'fantastica']|nr:LAFA_0D16798g1_1 [Lachancea sp. 'fantastica']